MLSCWFKNLNKHRGWIIYQLDSCQAKVKTLHESSIFDNRQLGEFGFQLIWTWPDFETFFLNLRSFWVRSLHSFEARFVSHMRSAPSKSWPAPAPNIVCGSARGVEIVERFHNWIVQNGQRWADSSWDRPRKSTPIPPAVPHHWAPWAFLWRQKKT